MRRLLLSITLILYICQLQGINAINNYTKSIKVVDWDIEQTKDFLFIGIFVFTVSLGKLVYHKLTWLASYVPESLLLIVCGIGAGLICKYTLSDAYNYHLTTNLFFLILLPPIVLDSAYRMYNRTFGDIFGIVMIMAVFGTIFCFFLIAFSLYGLKIAGAMGTMKPTNENIMSLLLFSSLIVAVDPVAVLAIFKDIGVDRELYYMVFGESLLNDAVTVVLYEIIKAFIHIRADGIKVIHVILGIISFFTVSGGGLLIGVVIGVFSSLLTRLESNSNIHCITLIITAYLSYVIANTLKWSGIISIIGCGIIQAAYAFKNISQSALDTVKEFIELVAGISEAIIFVFLGVELFINDLVWHVGFQIWAIVMCILSRSIVLLLLRVCINYVYVDQRKISWTEYFVATYGGLRGAVAFSLVSLIEVGLLDNNNSVEDERIRNLFITTTLLIIIFTVCIMGTTMKPLAKLLKVKIEKKATLSINNELNNAVVDNLMSVVEVIACQKGRNRFRKILSSFDNTYIRPLLVNDPFDNNSFKILKRYKQISLALHYASTNKSGLEQELIDVPQSLWPKSSRKLSNKEIQRKISTNLLHINIKKVSNNMVDPFSDERKFTSFLEATHNNRVKDMVHRKVSFAGNISQPTKRRRAFTLFSSSNLGYIEDFEENDFKEIKVSEM